MSISLENARKNLHDWLEDLEALKSWTDDPQSASRREFVEAFEVALERAKQAAKDYAIAVKGHR